MRILSLSLMLHDVPRLLISLLSLLIKCFDPRRGLQVVNKWEALLAVEVSGKLAAPL